MDIFQAFEIEMIKGTFGAFLCQIGKEETVVIGDRIYTDVKSGLNAGANTILVLSGESTLQTLDESPDKPHLVLENAGLLIPYLKQM
jgi:ribonucleotide monophosphatase NagD (HAD superfamily)